MSIDLEQLGYGTLGRKTGSLIAKPLSKDGNRVWQVTTVPTIEPVMLDELKLFSGIDGDNWDTMLEGFIVAARMAAENYLGKALIEQTITMKMDWWPGTVVELPQPPLISAKIYTLDENDVETEYDSDNYYIVTEAIPGKLVLKKSVSAPSNTARDYGGYLIRYKAGYGLTMGAVPKPIREGIKLWAAVIQATRVLDSKNPPPEARAMLDLFRVVGMMVR